MQVVPS